MSRFRLLRYKPASNPVADETAWNALRVLMAISVLVVPASVALCGVLAWISGQQYNYSLSDWQRCLVAPNTAFPGTSNPQQLAGALATFAGKAVVFLLLAFQATAYGIANHDVLPYSIFATFFATTGILLYRESSPIQPEPQQMSPTLITLTHYLNSETFSHLAYTRKQPPGVCDPAAKLMTAFLVFQYASLAIVFLCHCIAVYTAFNSPRSFRLRDVQLTSNKLTIVLAIVTMGAFFVTLVCKEIVAVQTLTVLQNSDLNSLFVFKKADLDVLTLTMMATCGVILVGSFQECLVKFWLAAFIALMHVVLSLPLLVATFAAYSQVTYPWKGPTYSMWNRSQCESYVAAKNSPGINFSAHPDQLRIICRQVPATLIGQTFICAAVFLQVLACLRVIYCNLHFYRPLEETRCRCCANRREDRGSFAIERVSSIQLYQGFHPHGPASFVERCAYVPMTTGEEKEGDKLLEGMAEEGQMSGDLSQEATLHTLRQSLLGAPEEAEGRAEGRRETDPSPVPPGL